ncbi:SsgA family sporulation/cell division regulator [Streptomyces cucumeris]|uniref:SsgA family sporulation/cell division regulator n=1 Tax=Streptomyces cucumeris TaxID=2962890 RepID=UPI003D71890D
MSTVIDQAVQAHLIASTPEARAIPACLRYEPDDPFAVRVSFPPSASLDGTTVEWTFGRELLAAGLRGPAGNGDVQMWPCGPQRTVLEFHAPEGMAMVQFDTGDLLRFLGRSYTVVPEGSEIGQLNLDDGLASLLGDAPA